MVNWKKLKEDDNLAWTARCYGVGNIFCCNGKYYKLTKKTVTAVAVVRMWPWDRFFEFLGRKLGN